MCSQASQKWCTTTVPSAYLSPGQNTWPYSTPYHAHTEHTHAKCIHIHSILWCKDMNVQYHGAYQSHASKAQLKTLCLTVCMCMCAWKWIIEVGRSIFEFSPSLKPLKYDSRTTKGGNMFHKSCGLNTRVMCICWLLFCYFLIPCLSTLGLQFHKFTSNHATDLIMCLKG